MSLIEFNIPFEHRYCGADGKGISTIGTSNISMPKAVETPLHANTHSLEHEHNFNETIKFRRFIEISKNNKENIRPRTPFAHFNWRL